MREHKKNNRQEIRRRKRSQERKKFSPSYRYGLSNVRIRLEFRVGLSSRRGTNTLVILLLLINFNTKKGNDNNGQRDRKTCGECSSVHGGECMVGF